jgi:hypothetical protein
MSQELITALQCVAKEVERSQAIYGSFASAHEGYAVLLEELDELKTEVWKRQRDYDAMAKEACQVAAMAIRLIIEIADQKVVDEYRWLPKADNLPLPARGALDICQMCGERIRYVDPYWDHQGGNKPRHLGTPTHYAIHSDEYQPTHH